MGFRKYSTFEGRATLPEFWYWILFCVIILWAGAVFAELAIVHPSRWVYGLLVPGYFYSIPFFLILALPFLAVSTRRLHDMDLSGWWQLVGLVPVLGAIIWVSLMMHPSGPIVFNRKRNPLRMRRLGLVYTTFGVATTAVILIVNIFHHLNSLAITSYPMGIALAGLAMYLVGSLRRNGTDDFLPL